MKPLLKRWMILGLGWLFLLLGVAGLFLPFLQGFLFLAIGLALLAEESETVRALCRRLKARHPRLAARVVRARIAVRRRFGRRSRPPGPRP